MRVTSFETQFQYLRTASISNGKFLRWENQEMGGDVIPQHGNGLLLKNKLNYGHLGYNPYRAGCEGGAYIYFSNVTANLQSIFFGQCVWNFDRYDKGWGIDIY